MASNTAGSTAAPAKSEKQIAAEALVALMAPGKAISQFNVGSDATGEPNMVVIYLVTPTA